MQSFRLREETTHFRSREGSSKFPMQSAVGSKKADQRSLAVHRKRRAETDAEEDEYGHRMCLSC